VRTPSLAGVIVSQEGVLISSEEGIMKLSSPKRTTFWIALLLVIIGIILNFVTVWIFPDQAIWVVVIGFIVLALGNLLEGF
jgi:hypothetical protein